MLKRLKYYWLYAYLTLKHYRINSKIKEFEEMIDRNPYFMINGYSVRSFHRCYESEAIGYDVAYKKMLNKRAYIHADMCNLIDKK